ncbi:MAG: hypothetical protein ACRC2R_16445 [Xenococcaceae cyanobacterium]
MLQKDIVELFAKQGVIDVDLECHTSVTSRLGNCVFLGSPESVERLVSRLSLRDFEAKDTEIEYKMFWDAEKASLKRGDSDYQKNRCYLIPAFHDLKLVKVYGVIRRPPQLKLSSSGQFENMFLYHRTDTDQVCVQVTYSYG